ncbi:MAG: hypothetical protein FD174_3915 [Geobacteraceae bacterium]|nr:MAG: hypothetical protein FD174_3915 [Geobacteraceae bacterium]
MKTLINLIIALVTTASLAFAAGGAESQGNGLFVWIFLGFGALIILYQMVPGFMLLGSMIKGFFSTASK